MARGINKASLLLLPATSFYFVFMNAIQLLLLEEEPHYFSITILGEELKFVKTISMSSRYAMVHPSQF
jgi:hypothetical protein